jgi:uncharacterized membrane protein
LQWFYAGGSEKVARSAAISSMTTWYALSLMMHLIGFAIWIGGMVFFLVVLGPAVHELEPGIAIRTLNRGRSGFELISWIAIGLLLATGIANLALRNPATAPPGNAYMILLGAKLFVFLAMTVHHFLQVFKYSRRIAAQTAAVLPSAGAWPEALLADWRRWFMLLKLNAALGPIAVLLGMALVKG